MLDQPIKSFFSPPFWRIVTCYFASVLIGSSFLRCFDISLINGFGFMVAGWHLFCLIMCFFELWLESGMFVDDDFD